MSVETGTRDGCWDEGWLDEFNKGIRNSLGADACTANVLLDISFLILIALQIKKKKRKLSNTKINMYTSIRVYDYDISHYRSYNNNDKVYTTVNIPACKL